MSSTIDRWFKALANQDRRRLVAPLAEHDPRSGDDLHIPEDVPTPERLSSEMYHSHLPMLEDAGLVHRDRDAHRVTKGPESGEIRRFLRSLEDDPDNADPYE